jgi:hypothetical protein
MDAVNRYWQIVRVLVLTRGLVVFLLSLFYLLAVFLAVTLEGDKRTSIVLVLSAIPACAFLAIATERVVLYSTAGASLGLPQQAELLRNSQIAVLTIFVGVPASAALLYGAQASLAALLLVPAALGALFALKGRWVFVAWIALAIGSRFFSDSLGALLSELGNPAVRLGLILASIATFYWWLGLASRTEKRARGTSTSLADARHESNAASMGDTVGLTAAQVEILEQTYDREIADVTSGIGDVGITSRALALGMGIDVRPNWRGVARMVGFGWAALLALHLIAGRNARDTLYLWIAIFAASALFSRFTALRMAWQLHGTEEAFLVLSPRWPPAAHIKRLFAELIVKCQIGVWLAWVLIILPFVVLGWLGRLEAGASILLLFATSCGASGALLFTVSLPHIKELSASTILLLLCAACGVASYFFGVVALPHARALGIGLILLPLIIGALSFSLRPLQFPVRIVSKH